MRQLLVHQKRVRNYRQSRFIQALENVARHVYKRESHFQNNQSDRKFQTTEEALDGEGRYENSGRRHTQFTPLLLSLL
jgi:hypothetical protein